MIEKNKTYSYEELKEIYKKAEIETIKKLDSEMDKAQKENGKDDALSKAIFSMQNTLVVCNLEKILFEEKTTYKFKVGDKVIGNDEAEYYGITNKGWIGTVTEVNENYFVANGAYELKYDCFDKYEESEEK